MSRNPEGGKDIPGIKGPIEHLKHTATPNPFDTKSGIAKRQENKKPGTVLKDLDISPKDLPCADDDPLNTLGCA